MEEYIYGLLDSAVAFPVSWGTLGSGTSTPRAVMRRTSGVQDHSMSGPGTMGTRVQVDCYGATYAEALAASRSVRGVLDGHRGGPGQGAFLGSSLDRSEVDAQLLHRVMLIYMISHKP